MEIRPHIPFKELPHVHLPKASFRRSLLSLAVLPAVLAVACDAQTPKTLPPEGFTRNPSDYEWSISIVVSRFGNNASIIRLHTKEKPVLKTEGGVGLLEAKSVYCEFFRTEVGKKAGCTAEFMGTFNFAGKDNITVADNPVKVLYSQCGGILNGKSLPSDHTVLVEKLTNEELGWTSYGIKDLGRLPNQCGNPSSIRRQRK